MQLSLDLATLVVHDLLLAKGGISAPKGHALRISVEHNRARLFAEFARARITSGFSSLDAWRVHINDTFATDGYYGESTQPRWFRINELRTSLEAELFQSFSNYETTEYLSIVLQRSTNPSLFIDQNVPCLIAVPSHIEITKLPGYKDGRLILQDKASCFPAYLLDAKPEDGDIIDACAAPGNKTTHLAALLEQQKTVSAAAIGNTKPVIYACERNKGRSLTLEKMVRLAGANEYVECMPNQDFLKLIPNDPGWARVGSLLVDPSCSGSGIIGRDDGKAEAEIDEKTVEPTDALGQRNLKRKKPSSPDTEQHTPLKERLQALSKFQLALLQHAMAFPAARKIVYSTCSVYAEENEHVVIQALDSEIAQKRGWRLLRRDEQVSGMRKWQLRGNCSKTESLLSNGFTDTYDAGSVTDLEDACIRCEKEGKDGTMGFFVVGFVRNSQNGGTNGESPAEEIWGGFSDEEEA